MTEKITDIAGLRKADAELIKQLKHHIALDLEALEIVAKIIKNRDEFEAGVKERLLIEYDKLKDGKDADDESIGHSLGMRDTFLEILVGKDKKAQEDELRGLLEGGGGELSPKSSIKKPDEEIRNCKTCGHGQDIMDTLDASHGEVDPTEELCCDCKDYSEWIPRRKMLGGGGR